MVEDTADVLSRQNANVVLEFNQRVHEWVFRRGGIRLPVPSKLAIILGEALPQSHPSLLLTLRYHPTNLIRDSIVSAIKEQGSLLTAFQNRGISATSDFKRVLLVSPYGDPYGKPLKYVVPHKGIESVSYLISTALPDVDTRVYNPNLTSVEEFYYFLSTQSFDVIGFSLLQSVIELNIEILSRTHIIQSHALILLGGHELPKIMKGLERYTLGPSLISLPSAHNTPHHAFLDFIEAVPVDIYCVDPVSIIDVVRVINRANNRKENLKAVSRLPGLVCYDGKSINANKSANKFFPNYIESEVIDGIPLSVNDLTHGTHYPYKAESSKSCLHYNRIGHNPLRVVLSDFCGAKCIFCSVNEFKRKPPPIEEVMHFIGNTYSGHDSIHFEHVDFLFNADYARRLTVALRDSEYSTVPKLITARVKEMTDDVADLFQQANIRIAAFGIESFSDDMLAKIGKGSTARENSNAIETAFRYGIRPGINMILFLPWDTLDSLRYTVDTVIDYVFRGAYVNVVPLMNAGYGRPLSEMSNILDYKLLDYSGMRKPLLYPAHAKLLDPELGRIKNTCFELIDVIRENLKIPDEHRSVAIESLLWLKAFYFSYWKARPKEDVSEQVEKVDQAIALTVRAQESSEEAQLLIKSQLLPCQPDSYEHIAIPINSSATSLNIQAYLSGKFPDDFQSEAKEKKGTIEIHRGSLRATESFLRNLRAQGISFVSMIVPQSCPFKIYRIDKTDQEPIYVIADVVGSSQELFVVQALHQFFLYPPSRIYIRAFDEDRLKACFNKSIGRYAGKIYQAIMLHEIDKYLHAISEDPSIGITLLERLRDDYLDGIIARRRDGRLVLFFDLRYAKGMHAMAVTEYLLSSVAQGGLGISDLTLHGSCGGVGENIRIGDLILYEKIYAEDSLLSNPPSNDIEIERLTALLPPGVRTHHLPIYNLPTVLNVSIELIKKIYRSGTGAVQLELAPVTMAVRRYPGTTFRSIFEVHDKPAVDAEHKGDALGQAAPFRRDENKHNQTWLALANYMFNPLPGQIRSLHYLIKGSPDIDTVGKSYSYLKLGSPKAITEWANKLSRRIEDELADSLGKNESVIACVLGSKTAVSGYLLARIVAKNLKLHCKEIVQYRRNADAPQSVHLSYASLPTKEERKRAVQGIFTVDNPETIRGKRVILIEDAYVTGTIIYEATKTLFSFGAVKVEPYVICYLDGKGDHSFEDRVNRKALECDGLQSLLTVISNENAAYTSRLLAYSFEVDGTTFSEGIISQLSPLARIKLYLNAILYFQQNPTSENIDININQLATALNVANFRTLALIDFDKLLNQVSCLLRESDYNIQPDLDPFDILGSIFKCDGF